MPEGTENPPIAAPPAAEDPRAFEFGSPEYIDQWGCDTPLQQTAQYMDGFGTYPEGSSNDCPHPDGPATVDIFLRRRWVQGYIDHGTLAGTIGNPTEEVVNAIYKALPVELQQIANGPNPSLPTRPEALTVLDSLHNLIETNGPEGTTKDKALKHVEKLKVLIGGW